MVRWSGHEPTPGAAADRVLLRNLSNLSATWISMMVVEYGPPAPAATTVEPTVEGKGGITRVLHNDRSGGNMGRPGCLVRTIRRRRRN